MNIDPGTKLHMVGYSPVFSENNEEFLHHFILRSCGSSDIAPVPMLPSQGFDDSELYHGKVISDCTNMPPGCAGGLGGWAVGSTGVTYPDDVGVSVGEERWVVLQTHYYNPDMVEGVYDSSGLRAYVTKDLRPIEAGTMAFVVGVTACEFSFVAFLSFSLKLISNICISYFSSTSATTWRPRRYRHGDFVRRAGLYHGVERAVERHSGTAS